MLKRFLISLILSIFLLMGVSIFPTVEASPQKSLKFTFVSGTVGGTWYPTMGAIAELLMREVPGTSTHCEPGGSYSNLIAVNRGEAQFGLSAPGPCTEAWTGERYFKDKGVLKNIRTICATIPLVFQTVALEKSGIKTYADFKGKRYIPALKGQTSYEMAKVVLMVYGLNMEDTKVMYFGMREAIDAMKDLKADAYSTMTSFPQPTFLDLSRSHSIVMLGMTKDKQEDVLRQYPGFSPFTMKGGSYTFMKEDTLTTVQSTLLIANKDVPEEIVYKLTKAIYKNRDYLINVHTSLDYITAENSLNDINLQLCPLHEGAARYYREIGMKIPDKVKP
jgi:TRAP transporter TAXI family solute receptor